jgi:hypothetical protein
MRLEDSKAILLYPMKEMFTLVRNKIKIIKIAKKVILVIRIL